MSSQTNSSTSGHQTPQSSTATPRLGWWSRPIVTYPPPNTREPTRNEEVAYYGPFCAGLHTAIAVFFILFFIDHTNHHAKFSIQSITVSPEAATSMWHVDFLVKNPRWRYSVYYGGDDVSVRLGPINAAVLNLTRKYISRYDTAFSLVFVGAEGNRSDVVYEQLDVKLRGKHKRFVLKNAAGYFDISCRNLSRSSEKIVCQSSFTKFDTIDLDI